MDPRLYNNTKNHALSVANAVAPNASVQSGFVKIVRQMEAEAARPEAVIRAIVNSIADGMNHGNWPKP